MASELPVVDFAPFLEANRSYTVRRGVASSLTAACHRYGFVVIFNHGLPSALLGEAFHTLHRLFALDTEDKMKAPHPAGSVPHRGYSAPGSEKVYTKEEVTHTTESVRKISDFKESYEIGSEANRVQYNIWLPEAVLPGFRRFSLDLYWRLNELAERLLDAFAMGLDLTEEECHYLKKEVRSGHNNQLRFLHYPPVPKNLVEREVVARMPAHTDWSLFTLLFQDSVGGLELQDPHCADKFLEARPSGDALVLNTGDMFERLTNGYFPSALHRVALPSPLRISNAIEENPPNDEMVPPRYSIPYFFAPDDDKVIKTLKTCVKDGDVSKYEDVKFEDYAELRARHSYVKD